MPRHVFVVNDRGGDNGAVNAARCHYVEHDCDGGHEQRPQVFTPETPAIIECLPEPTHAPKLQIVLFDAFIAYAPVGSQSSAGGRFVAYAPFIDDNAVIIYSALFGSGTATRIVRRCR